ncbi:MAG TPA: hypothetical protein VMT89_02315 [Candidatus Acidoferrales bacterium]|nr:hypothetical protein [Candidatus Acidoferrales bacterium]
MALIVVVATAAAFIGCRREPQLPTSTPGAVGDRLRQWWREGSAAGNLGDFYDNRDGGHSDFDLSQWPQIERVAYSDEFRKQRWNYGPQTVLLPHVVFGNSSTAYEPTAGGSNPTFYYESWKEGLPFLDQQYRGNNIYVYPAHHDYSPGHNGTPQGFGDLYPTNTPYLIISQGSSHSDQPFLHAIAAVLAAFHSDVKRTLAENGMLIPTVQWLLRSTNKQLRGPNDYFSGKAHPSAFDAGHLDELAAVEKAHALTADALPPLVNLRVVTEEEPKAGVDYFDPAFTERLADSHGVIARIFRGREYWRRLVVSAEDSVDLNKRPLSFRWVVLRGEQGKTIVTPQNSQGAVAAIDVAWQPRHVVTDGSDLESNRVDVGVFASNGLNDSPPAFVTFFTLDSEKRIYDTDGRIVEIDYDPTNFVAPRLSAPKAWRDVYRYDSVGRCVGWTRYENSRQSEFDASGNLVLEKDALGRSRKARTVRYEQAAHAGDVNPNPLRWRSAGQVVEYEYAGDADFIGHVVATKPEPAATP